MKTIKNYRDLVKYKSFKDRFEYLKLDGNVGMETFGSHRWINQYFYKTAEWLKIRRDVIIRDCGCDLGVDGYQIFGKIIIHHMNPLDEEDILNHSDLIISPEYLVCVSFDTHNALHYGSYDMLGKEPIIRTPNDTCPWKGFNSER